MRETRNHENNQNEQGNDSLTLVSFLKREEVVNFAIMERIEIDHLMGIEGPSSVPMRRFMVY